MKWQSWRKILTELFMKLYKHSERGSEDNNRNYLFVHSPGSKSSLLGPEKEMI